MMETLEQQQTKSTPNSEPHAGNTETTPAASEEDDIEEHCNAFELEKEEKNSSSPLRELSLKNVAEQDEEQSRLENGRDTEEEPAASQETAQGTSSTADSLDESFELPAESSVKVECVEDVGDTAEGSDAEEKPSTLLDAQKSPIDIKVETKSPLPALKDDFADEPSSLPGKPDEQQNGEIATAGSPAMQFDTEASLHDELSLTDNIKVEEKSPLPCIRPDEEDVSSPAIKMPVENSPYEQKSICETSSPVYRVVGESFSNDEEDNVSPTIKVIEKKSSPANLQEEERSSSFSSALKISNDIKIEGDEDFLDRVQGNDDDGEEEQEDEAASSPAFKIDEDEFASTANATKERELTSPATTAATPVYKINDLSPASIPDDDDDEDSSQGFNAEIKIEEASPKLPKIERKSPMEIIKIESDSEDEDVQVEVENDVDEIEGNQTTATDSPQLEPQIEQSDNLIKQKQKMETPRTPSPSLPSLKVKINGAHAAMEELQPMSEVEQERMQDAVQQSVIANNEKEEQLELHHSERRSSRSSSSSSVSSTSQQLVIDQPESEQQLRKQQQQQQQSQEPEPEKNQQLLLALKRRRSGSNSNSDSDNNPKPTAKQQCVETETSTEEQQPSSLLLQRLQAPAPNSGDLEQQLSCYKCNANKFENFQQLNAHFAQCKAHTEAAAATATTSTAEVAAAAATAAIPAPAAVAVPLASPAPAPALKKERFFRCARCSTVHQCWNFFLHMREVHQRYICLYCSHVFASVEKLSLHLENKHDMDQRHFANIEAWQALQSQEDRARYLVCCNCQASFARGSHFDDHDCAELMQPCALCGQKAGHANGCRNSSSTTATTANNSGSSRKKTAARRKRKTAKSKQLPNQQLAEEQPKANNQQEEESNWMETDALVPPEVPPQPTTLPENNIPAPIEVAPQEDAVPKLVVPKMMLRVPKEFQKSVDAALSSTDTEDEDNDELATSAAAEAADVGESESRSSAVPLLTVDAVEQQQQQHLQPMSSLSEDTETATETASTFQETAPTMPANVSLNDLEDDEDSPALKLPLVLAEFERTKLDIERTMALMVAKRELQEQQQQQRQLQQQLQQQQLPTEVKQQRGRWSLTPPASPHNNPINETTHVPNAQVQLHDQEQLLPPGESVEPAAELLPAPAPQRRDTLGSECMELDDSLNEEQNTQQSEQTEQSEQLQQPLDAEPAASATPPPPPPPADGIEVAGADTHTVDLQLDRPLDKFEMVDFVRLCLKAVYPFCLYCNHARRIAVNAKQLALHLIGQHRFTATVDSITAEELQAETIVAKLKSYLPALEGNHYLNSMSCCSLEQGRFVQPFNERIYECFQCRYVTATHKELYTHNRRLHIKTNITCCMCRLNFFSYSELLCHICPGIAAGNVFDVQFRCCLCETAPLASAFRLMVHLRKQHQACDICLEDCHTQAKLSAHVWKHKLLHLCYRCGIAYRNKQDISKHLFWKHGTESTSCKRCLQKRWRHVYHFCVPAAQFTCEHCQFTFSKAIYLEVHKRQHVGDYRYACNEEQCEEKFVSRKLLLKHAAQHEVKQLDDDEEEEESSKDQLTKLELEEQRTSSAASDQRESNGQQLKTENEPMSSPKSEATHHVDGGKLKDKTPQPALSGAQREAEQTPRKRRKKAKRNKASLEDLNLIAPNLSESDSSDDSDSDAGRSTGTLQDSQAHGTLPMRASVDDLDMPRIMLSPASESDNEEPNKELIKSETEPKQEQQLESVKQQSLKAETETELADGQKPKLETTDAAGDTQELPDIWKNLLQNQPTAVAKKEPEAPEVQPTEEQLRPTKLHVACSDHDYCKMQRTPPPTPVPTPEKPSHVTPNKPKRSGNTASSDSDSSSSSSSNSDSDSSSCSCGSNCSCSSSGSSSSDDDSDNESQKSPKSPSKKVAKKNCSSERIQESQNNLNNNNNNNSEEYVNVTSNNEEELRPVMPSPKAPLYNESDFDTAVSDTDEEFYDAHPQKMASEMLAQKRLALLSAQATEAQPQDGSGNYGIVENSRPSTPSLPEEAAAFADKRERVAKNKKKKRERKSTCKSMSQAKMMPSGVPQMVPPQQLPLGLAAAAGIAEAIATPLQQQQQQLLLLPESPLTPITHRPSWQPRMSEGSSCSDADGQLKRSKRTRRPNKFYGYTSDDENMSSVLAPPLQVGMQLIKPQPPPQLTWAKEDLPTPAKQQRSRSNHGEHHNHHHHHQHQQLQQPQQQQHSHQHSNGSTRKRNRRTPLSGAGSGSARRGAKRVKQQPATPAATVTTPQVEQLQLPPIPTLKIRPALLPVSAAPSDSSDSSSDDENAEINVTSLLPPIQAPSVMMQQPPVVVAPAPVPLPTPPPPPATTAFNQPIPPALLPNPDFATLQYFKANNIRYPIRPPAGARLAREGESVYCYCRCPYDEVSEMIACDGDNCLIEWFHFECVGIMVAPQGKWFCAECRPKYSEGLYPGVKAK
ncbi:uncharacterized protein MESR4 [Drosophila montana]|uniref:uncharacterized protein MESR4 n=1 Tax=Drosophila montana TaxID=40370 RepID=UPI00313EDA76